MPIKLNIGCGFNKMEGCHNIDKIAECNPDKLLDVSKQRLPYPRDVVEEVYLIHSLEHIGETSDEFIFFIKELHRVCKAGAIIYIAVPHPRHDSFLNDPTHCRVITPDIFQLFNRKCNLEWIEQKAPNSCLALYHNVDFELVKANGVLSESYERELNAIGYMDRQLEDKILTLNNVVIEYDIVLKVLK